MDVDGTDANVSRRSWRVHVVVGLAVTAVVLALGVLVVYLATSPGPEGPRPAATGAATGGISVAVDRQTSAYARGDDDSWLAVVNPDNPQLRERLSAHLQLLRSVGVVSVEPHPPIERGFPFEQRPVVEVPIVYAICVQLPDCSVAVDDPRLPRTESYAAHTTWRLRPDGGYVLDGFDITPTANTPPWLTEDLQIRSTPRVTLVAPAELADRMLQIQAQADQAAEVADRYARWIRPTRYVVYIAGPQEWERWFDGPSSGDAIGYAVPTSRTSSVVVLNAAVVDAALMPEVLRHELGHVVTLFGVEPTHGPVVRLASTTESLLAEGIAEYIAYADTPSHEYPGLADVRTLVQEPGWTLDLEQVAGLGSPSSEAYGIGFFTWRCIDATFGEEAMFDLIEEVLRSHRSPEEAAPGVLGTTWPDVERTCTTFIRTAAT